MSAIVRMVSWGGTVRPLRTSRTRLPPTTVSTVTTRTRYPQAAARSTSSRVSPLSVRMYSWNHRSPGTAAASSAIDVVAIVDSV